MMPTIVSILMAWFLFWAHDYQIIEDETHIWVENHSLVLILCEIEDSRYFYHGFILDGGEVSKRWFKEDVLNMECWY